jgi:hypothetical protein
MGCGPSKKLDAQIAGDFFGASESFHNRESSAYIHNSASNHTPEGAANRVPVKSNLKSPSIVDEEEPLRQKKLSKTKKTRESPPPTTSTGGGRLLQKRKKRKQEMEALEMKFYHLLSRKLQEPRKIFLEALSQTRCRLQLQALRMHPLQLTNHLHLRNRLLQTPLPKSMWESKRRT